MWLEDLPLLISSDFGFVVRSSSFSQSLQRESWAEISSSFVEIESSSIFVWRDAVQNLDSKCLLWRVAHAPIKISSAVSTFPFDAAPLGHLSLFKMKLGWLSYF